MWLMAQKASFWRRVGMSNETGALYRRHAAACVKIAQELTDPGRRVSLLDMARTWIALAQRSEAMEAIGSNRFSSHFASPKTYRGFEFAEPNSSPWFKKPVPR